MKYIYVLAFSLFTFSCNNKEKEFQYYYIETYEELSLLGDRTYIETSKPDTIFEISDSSAYLEAFEKFTLSKKINKDMKEALGSVYKKPLSFQLLDKVGNDITYTTFFDKKDSIENEIEKSIFSKKNSLRRN
ncbi:hypothetical protein OBK20_04860 [Empedobacter falsenii]